MEIIYTNSYTKNGCNFNGKLGLIEYSRHDQRRDEFNGAYRRGGLYDQLDKAKAVMQEKHPNAVVKLGIPDLVFQIVD